MDGRSAEEQHERAARAALGSISGEMEKYNAILDAIAPSAAARIAKSDALAKAAAGPTAGSASLAALHALFESPGLEAARKAAVESGALRALATSPVTDFGGPSPVTSALVKAAAHAEESAPARRPAAPAHRLGPQKWRRALTSRVSQLGDRQQRRYEGAWDAIFHDGPDSLSQAATSIVELIKGALRESASNDEVNAWLGGLGDPDWGRDTKGFPTHRARAQFLLVQGAVPDRSAEAFAMGLSRSLMDLEEVKHGRLGASMSFVVSVLLFFESMLLASAAGQIP